MTVCEADDEVRPVFADHSPVDVQDLKSQMIVLDPGRHIGVLVQMKGLRGLPGAVIDAKVDVALELIIY